MIENIEVLYYFKQIEMFKNGEKLRRNARDLKDI